MSAAIPQLSVIVPTLNEAGNLPELLRRTDGALTAAGVGYEVILVDDGSTDDTEQIVSALVRNFPVRLIQRGRGAEGGLSGAVLAGFREAKGTVLAVMDADLQHPPEVLPRLLEALGAERGQESPEESIHQSEDARKATPDPIHAEMVVGSRYVPGASVGERWGLFRKLNSRLATLLARPFAGRVRDPMSGLFALPRYVFDRGDCLSPLGYKILLELLCKCRPARVAEVPIHFAERTAGDSKLTLKEQFRYLEHLSRLYDFTFPRFSPIAKFAIVVILSWLVGMVISVLLPLGYDLRLGGAYLGAIGVTALFHWRYVRTQREFLIRPTPWLDFSLSAAAELATFLLVASYLASLEPGRHHSIGEEFTIPFLVAILVRYIIRKELLLDVRGLRPEERGILVEARREREERRRHRR